MDKGFGGFTLSSTALAAALLVAMPPSTTAEDKCEFVYKEDVNRHVVVRRGKDDGGSGIDDKTGRPGSSWS